MDQASKIKNALTMWLCALIVTLSLGETRAENFFATPSLELEQNQTPTQASTREITFAYGYDASDYALAPKSGLPLEIGKQGKHIPGHNNFIPGRSPLTHKNPQSLLDNFAGKGQPVGKVPRGQPGFKERVDFGEVIGEVGGNPTTKGIIHHSKNGAHIVPANP